MENEKQKLKFPLRMQEAIEIVNMLSKLIQLEFGVTKEEAEELIHKVSEYNIQCSADVLELIEDEFGYKSKFRR